MNLRHALVLATSVAICSGMPAAWAQSSQAKNWGAEQSASQQRPAGDEAGPAMDPPPAGAEGGPADSEAGAGKMKHHRKHHGHGHRSQQPEQQPEPEEAPANP